MKKLIVFDLDGTLAESKSPIDKEMAKLLRHLLDKAKVAVISGGSWKQFQTQFLGHLRAGHLLDQLSILPTCGTQFYAHDKSFFQLSALRITCQ